MVPHQTDSGCGCIREFVGYCFRERRDCDDREICVTNAPPKHSATSRKRRSVSIFIGLLGLSQIGTLSVQAQTQASEPEGTRPVRDNEVVQFADSQRQIENELLSLEGAHQGDSFEQWRDVIRAWHEANATRLDSLRQQSKELFSAETPIQDAPVIAGTDLSSAEMSLVLDVAGVQREMQQLWSSASNAEQARDKLVEWHEANAGVLVEQRLRFDRIGADASVTEITVPAAPFTLQDEGFRSFLEEDAALRNEVVRIRDAFPDNPEHRRDAVRDWYEQNRELLRAHQENAAELFGFDEIRPSEPSPRQ